MSQMRAEPIISPECAAAHGLVNFHASVNLQDWASNKDPSGFILVIVVRAALINVSAATVLFGLTGRQAAISPPSFLTVTPSGGMSVMVAISSIFKSVAMLPAPVIVNVGMLVAVMLFIVISVIRHHRRAGAQGHDQSDDCKLQYPHVTSHNFFARSRAGFQRTCKQPTVA